MNPATTRRRFLQNTLAFGAGLPIAATANRAFAEDAQKKIRSPNEKLNIAVIGVAGRGAANLKGVSHETIAVLCDIDRHRLEAAGKSHPQAKREVDFRRALDHPGLDAVVVSTPDHMHAFPALGGLRRGLDVYSEKPLAHSVWEVRTIREETAKQKAVTQMGTQIHSLDNYRRVVEKIRAGMIGAVRRVHVCMGGNQPIPGQRVTKGTPPAHVDYDRWLGPAPERPYHESHFHFRWRYWWDFGGGVLADFGCHFMDLPHWALELGAPTSVEARGRKEYEGDNEVPSVMRVDYQYPARKSMPPVHLTWYHGSWAPDVFGKRNVVMFEGERGMLLADYTWNRVYFGDDAGQIVAPPEPWIPASIGHHREWTEAVKSRGPTTCNFDYSGNLAEAVLLGNVAYRAGAKLEWDSAKLKATNTDKAAPFVRRKYREGWTL